MARNKYPEVTVEKILEVAQRLFWERGFEETTIQHIVDGLDGLTRGAIYHHFKSKEDIMEALLNKLFAANNPFVHVQQRSDLSGLEKLRLAIMLNQNDEARMQLSQEALPLLKNPRILAGMIETNRKQLTPHWQQLIEEGIQDGSIATEYARPLAELLPLLEIWLMPSVYPATQAELYEKFRFISEMLMRMGLPLFTEEMVAAVKQRLTELQ